MTRTEYRLPPALFVLWMLVCVCTCFVGVLVHEVLVPPCWRTVEVWRRGTLSIESEHRRVARLFVWAFAELGGWRQ